MPPEKYYLPDSTCIRVTVAEKIVSEDHKVTGLKCGTKSCHGKTYMPN